MIDHIEIITPISLSVFDPSIRCRITLRLTCNMKLQKFPLDRQTCLLKMESCEYRDGLSNIC